MENEVVKKRTQTQPMLIKHDVWTKLALILSDLFSLSIAAMIANALHWVYLDHDDLHFMSLWTGELADPRLLILALLILLSIAAFLMLGHYSRRRPFWEELPEILRVLIVLAALDATMLYLSKLQFSRFWFIGLWLGAIVLIPSLRRLTKRILLKLNLWQRPAIVLGTGQNARETAAALQSDLDLGYKVLAFAIPKSVEWRENQELVIGGCHIPLIKFDSEDPSCYKGWNNSTLVVAYDQQDELNDQIKFVSRLHRQCDDLHIALPLRGLPLFGTRINYFFRHEVLFLSLTNNLARHGPRFFKRTFDLILSSLLLLVTLPILCYLVFHIRRDGGNALYVHERIGQRGEPFNCLKFRTMVPNAQLVLDNFLATNACARIEWECGFKLKADPRVTPMGRILRRYSLDELPQLWNVFIGEMSLVGPRPIVECELQRYGEDADFYLETKPGITGLWQISGRNDTSYSERVYLDVWYAKNWSLWMDIVILAKTVSVVLRNRGAY